MKSHGVLAFLVVSVLLSSAYAEVDPRVLEILRKENGNDSAFCFSFAQEGIGNGPATTGACTTAASDRALLSLRIADPERSSTAKDFESMVFADTSSFCAEVGEYAMGAYVAEDCNAWNAARSTLALFAIANPKPDASATSEITRQIEGVRTSRLQFCRTLQAAGNRGDIGIFRRRINACLTSSNLARDTDRAIYLGDFSVR